uniref:Exosome subunit n=1 Tax=uncultured Poseidoniia archaeon TaxID=1697135 RepID=A0A1B1TDG3_9ARCH|nr:hypothetical protein [uncultured Candidatus Thalassoarchaea sp.]
MVMSLHSATWRVHVSELDDSELIIESIEWVAGENAIINMENGKSIHGAKQKTIIAKVESKRESCESFLRLGKEALMEIIEDGITKRIDENKNFHIRIDVSSLVSKKININYNKEKLVAKGIFKIECYPGDSPEKIILQLIEKNING